MPDQTLIDTWARLEVEWREAFQRAAQRQSEYDTKMTNHLVYHFAAPSLEEQDEIDELWRLAMQKRTVADDFIAGHHG